MPKMFFDADFSCKNSLGTLQYKNGVLEFRKKGLFSKFIILTTWAVDLYLERCIEKENKLIQQQILTVADELESGDTFKYEIGDSLKLTGSFTIFKFGEFKTIQILKHYLIISHYHYFSNKFTLYGDDVELFIELFVEMRKKYLKYKEMGYVK